MSSEPQIKTKAYEYIIYWLVTFFILILAIPVAIMSVLKYLLKILALPLKSWRHFLAFMLILLLAIVSYVVYHLFIPYDIGVQVKNIMVAENDNFPIVLKKLVDNGLVEDKQLFKLLAVAGGIDKSIIPGRYDFSGRVSLYGIYRKFKRQEIATLLITIPEGLTVNKIAGLFQKNLDLDSAAFVNLAFDTSYTRAHYGLDDLEGYLFPETYRFQYGVKIEQVFDIMLDEFNRRTKPVFDASPENSLSKEQTIILASIIEAEARFDDEKSTIASVYHNRLDDKMRLQADPTVIYALGGLDRPLYYKDLEYDSPYNTYRYHGLPPGPINSPGLASIVAALIPDTSEYYYFVADGSGRHIFSRTLREHNRAKNQIKKLKKQSGNI